MSAIIEGMKVRMAKRMAGVFMFEFLVEGWWRRKDDFVQIQNRWVELLVEPLLNYEGYGDSSCSHFLSHLNTLCSWPITSTWKWWGKCCRVMQLGELLSL